MQLERGSKTANMMIKQNNNRVKEDRRSRVRIGASLVNTFNPPHKSQIIGWEVCIDGAVSYAEVKKETFCTESEGCEYIL